MRNTVTIYADGDLDMLGDLRRNVAIAEANLEDAKSAERPRHGDTYDDEQAAIDTAKAAYDAALDAAAERAESWTVDHIGHGEFRELLKQHPARKVDAESPAEGEPKQVTHPDDEGFGANMESFPKALLLYVDSEDPEIRTIIEPAENVARKVKRLSVGQFETLFAAAWAANMGGVIDPKATRFSIAATPAVTLS